MGLRLRLPCGPSGRHSRNCLLGDRRRVLAAGFTLVELAVVLVIMGIVGRLLYGTIIDYVAGEKVEFAEHELESTAKQLSGLTLGGDPIPAAGAGNTLPTGVRGHEDQWGADVLYWPASELTSSPVRVLTETSLQVDVYSDNGSGGTFPAGDATLVRTIPNVGFVVVSTGPNMALDVAVDTSGGNTTISILNVTAPLNDGSGRDFDDIVRHKPLGELKAEAFSVGR